MRQSLDLTGKELTGKDLTEARITTPIADSPPVPMSRIWRTIRDFILWSYERGTLQYDVMVTIILLFVFFSPYWINFHDKPVERNPHPIGVVVTPDAGGGLIYQIEGTAISGTDDATVRQQLLRVVEPISGEVSITRYEALRDRQGQVLTYKVWVQKE
ncbi:MAG: hypothetical protein ACRD20_01490 [Terriglobales bacterium]